MRIFTNIQIFIIKYKINMEKWYVVDDGSFYNVLSEEDLAKYEIEQDQIIKVFNNPDMAFNLVEKLNRKREEASPNFSPSKGYYDESKKNMKATLTETQLSKIITESVKRILSESIFDTFPSMAEKKKENNEPKHNEDDVASSKKRERVITRLKSDGIDVAQYAYRLWPNKDEDSARSYFYKCLDGKTNDSGDVYKFTPEEINRLYSMLSNNEL